jgi:hypothetical protein
MTVSAASQKVRFLRRIFANLDNMPEEFTRMLEDNNGCMTMSINATTPGKTKHIYIRHHFIRELVKIKAAVMEYSPIAEMIADAPIKFTLPTTVYLKHIRRMLSGTYSWSTPG